MSKITPLRMDTLRVIRDGKVRMVNTGTAAYRIFGASPHAVGWAVAQGLAWWPKGPVGEQTCEITANGQAALSEPRHD